MQETAALTNDESDTFSVTFDTYLNGQTRLYDEYTESEHDVRDYSIISIDDSRVEWTCDRTYNYNDNEGGWGDESGTIDFLVNASDGRYLENTYDGPASFLEYYTYDNIWFQIDPTLEVGSTVHILGYDYTVWGLTTVFTDLFTAVDVIEVRIRNAYKEIFDPEYDPGDSIIELTFDESYYYDPTSGYFVYNTWRAQCSTSIGNFEWTETGVVTASSYQLSINVEATMLRVILILVGIVAFVGLIFGARYGMQSKWRNHANQAIGIISGTVPAPKSKKRNEAPTLWNPLSLRYQELIENIPASTVSLAPGVFVITDPFNKMAVVDTTDRKSTNLVFPFKESNLALLYKLALGVIGTDSQDHHLCLNKLTGVQEHIETVAKPMSSDPHSISVFGSLDKVLDDRYEYIVELMAKRRVLDYSLGQAPLSPASHLLKLNHIIQFSPEKVLLVGDDDLLSISLAKYGIKVTVLEVDPYTCALISSISKEEDMGIVVHQVDLRAPLPMNMDETFDLFVADPDFTIEAFTLFLSRGLSLLREGGIGLINFENKSGQKFKAHHVIKQLNLDLVDQVQESWNYTIVTNQVAHRTGSGKYTSVTYTDVVQLGTAPYKSTMFKIRRTPDARIILPKNQGLRGPDYIIYDF